MKQGERRDTVDVVVIAITAVVSIVIVVMALGLVILAFVEPDEDHAGLATVITDLVTVALGGLIGFIGGRATVKKLNGHDNDNEVVLGGGDPGGHTGASAPEGGER